MGDEPYAALLPWVVFAVIDRGGGDGPLWAAGAALVAAVTLLLTSSERSARPRNVAVIGAIVWFAAMAIADASHLGGSSYLGDYGRTVSAAGFAVIAFGSLAFTPAIEHYTRARVRPSRHASVAFARMNVAITFVWGVAAVAVAVSHACASALATEGALTTLNWVVPIAIVSVAAHRSRDLWDEFNDDVFDEDPLRDLALDWNLPPARDL